MAMKKDQRFLDIDGSHGEGGGQVLRTSLSLSAITGQPLRIDNIRAGRKKPGLAAQHLASVRAASSICSASISGDFLRSTTLYFVPGSSVAPGAYTFDIGQGSAGSVSLVLQTVLLPLAMAGGTSQVTLTGGTHVDFSPNMTYIEQIYLPTLRSMGIHVSVDIKAWGWNPAGGGSVEVTVHGNPALSGLCVLQREDLVKIRCISAGTKISQSKLQETAMDAKKCLLGLGFGESVLDVRSIVCPGPAFGRGLFICAEYEKSVAGFGCVSVTGQAVKQTCEDMAEFHRDGAPVDEHLGDQLLLPACLAMERSDYKVAKVTLHLKTNAWVIEKFGVAKVVVDESTNMVSILPNPISNT